MAGVCMRVNITTWSSTTWRHVEDELTEKAALYRHMLAFLWVNSELYAGKHIHLIVVLMVRLFSLSWRDIASQISHTVLRKNHLIITSDSTCFEIIWLNLCSVPHEDKSFFWKQRRRSAFANNCCDYNCKHCTVKCMVHLWHLHGLACWTPGHNAFH